MAERLRVARDEWVTKDHLDTKLAELRGDISALAREVDYNYFVSRPSVMSSSSCSAKLTGAHWDK